MKKKRMMLSEADTRRQQVLSGIIKENYDEDPIYGDDPMIDSPSGNYDDETNDGKFPQSDQFPGSTEMDTDFELDNGPEKDVEIGNTRFNDYHREKPVYDNTGKSYKTLETEVMPDGHILSLSQSKNKDGDVIYAATWQDDVGYQGGNMGYTKDLEKAKRNYRDMVMNAYNKLNESMGDLTMNDVEPQDLSDEEDEDMISKGKQQHQDYLDSVISKEDLENDYEGHIGGYNLAMGHRDLSRFFDKMKDMIPDFEEDNNPTYAMSKELEKARLLYKADILSSAQALRQVGGDYIQLLKKSMGFATGI